MTPEQEAAAVASIVAKQLDDFENGEKPAVKDIIASLASLVTIAAVIAYGCGWFYTRSYLATLEASWYLTSLPYQVIVSAGWPSLSSLLLGMFLSFYSLTQGMSATKARRASMILVGLLCAAWSYALYQPADWKWRELTIGLTLSMLTAETGFSIGRAFPYINTRHPLWIVMGSNYGILMISTLLLPIWVQEAGQTKAASALQSGCTELSEVKSPTLPGIWHIVYLNGEVALASSCSRNPLRISHALIKLTDSGVVVSKRGLP